MEAFSRRGILLFSEEALELDPAQVLAWAGVVAAHLERQEGNPAHDLFYRHGFHLLRKHYYLPLPDEADLASPCGSTASQLIGLDMNEAVGLDLLEQVLPAYVEEFRAHFPLQPTGNPRDFYLINGGYMAVDAHVYYGLIRHLKPGRIIEIGSGFSTLLAGQACLKNQEETGRAVQLIALEPYPWDILREGIPGLSQLIPVKVQDADLALFTGLQAGDFLFIDSSHALRTGGDVQMEYLEILPRLSPGVLVHVHDISLPKPYPRVYFENQLYWNEQYLLQAFLAFNKRFEVLWPGNYLMERYPERMRAVFPEFDVMRQHYPLSEPSAFWMRVRQASA